MELIETIPLQNGLRLTIQDLSRRIAADTVKVEISIQMKVKVEESFFASSDDHRQLTDIFGDELTYEHKLERTFVSDAGRDRPRPAAENVQGQFLQYLSSPNFARKMALSLLRDIKGNPYKYRRALWPKSRRINGAAKTINGKRTMTRDFFEELLAGSEKPSRYIGTEVNAVRKENAAVRFALAFPDTYEVGMSHLGLQILYAVLNALPGVSAERCFAPWPDGSASCVSAVFR
jgi:hypothetical protein